LGYIIFFIDEVVSSVETQTHSSLEIKLR